MNYPFNGPLYDKIIATVVTQIITLTQNPWLAIQRTDSAAQGQS